MTLSIDILLVEDDDADAVLLSRHLEPLLGAPVTRAPNLALAAEQALAHRFDVAGLDLGLPDAWGLDALLRFGRRVPDLPVIVLTGTQEPAFAEKARRSGVIGFVSKTLPPEDVAAQVLPGERGGRRGRSPGGEWNYAGGPQMDAGSRSAATAKIYGRTDLGESDPETWAFYVARYGDLLDLVLEQATFTTELNVAEHLQAFATGAGFPPRAGPRDVVSIHTSALRKRVAAANGIGVDQILAESRFAVLETMGHLAAYYRTASIGASSDRAVPGA